MNERLESEIIESLYPPHLSAKEVAEKWPSGRNVEIESVSMEEVYDRDNRITKQMPALKFCGIERWLIIGKITGRRLFATHGRPSQWIGRQASIVAVKRTSGQWGVDVREPVENEK